MDKRIEKTKTALYNAFMELRAKKKLRDIKILELCQTAGINKTTFYAHYKDIHELSEDVEKQLLYKIINSIPQNNKHNISESALYTKEIMLAFKRYDKEMDIVFSGRGMNHLSVFLEQALKNAVFDEYPFLKNNPEMNIMLSYCIHGAFHAHMNNRNLPFSTILSTIEKITQTIQPLLKECGHAAAVKYTE